MDAGIFGSGLRVEGLGLLWPNRENQMEKKLGTKMETGSVLHMRKCPARPRVHSTVGIAVLKYGKRMQDLQDQQSHAGFILALVAFAA